ncbi:protein FAM200A-like [Palaemon carinicauda]|uniref:protein FAM200A-like n=1 Tax=Palaemon carinicauda TaxID=392227 RepID=UPI0035B58A4B
MTGKLRGLVSRVQSIVPQVKATHCCIHREQLAVKHMPTCLKTVLEEAVKIVNFIKGKALNTRLFTVLYKVDIEKVSVNLSSKEADNLVEIATSGTLKTLFRERSLANFWAKVQPEYPGLAEIALKHLMPFPTTYNCEIGFSTLVDLKTKKHNRINVEPDMRLKLSRLEPDIPTVVRQQKQYHSSH